MHPAIPPALFTFGTAFSMAVYVITRRRKETLHWLLFALLASLAVWPAGVLVRFAASDLGTLAAGLKLTFTGIIAACSFWLLLAAHYTQFRPIASQRFGILLVLVPAALFCLALLTNDGHRLFIRKVDFLAVETGPRAYVGPLFWAFIVWAYASVAIGVALYVRAARTILRAQARTRGLLIAFVAVVPLAASAPYVFEIMPVGFDLTPTALVVSLVLICLVVFRYDLLDTLPLARRAIVDQLDEGVVMATAGGRITAWNRAAERMLRSPHSPSGRSLLDVLGSLAPSDTRPAVVDALEEMLVVPGRRVEVTTSDRRVLEIFGAKVDEGSRESTGQFAILSDRSEQSVVEERARQTQRLETVGALAAGVAHEVNDPLAFVRANLIEIERLGERVAQADPDEDPALVAELQDLRAIAGETLDGVERIRRIVGDMQRLASAPEATLGCLDLAEVAETALGHARLDEVPEIAVELQLPTLPPTLGRRERLVQVVLNLLRNARQALEGVEEPKLRMEALDCGDELELWVEDNGHGVPEAIRDRIFDPFFTTRDPDVGMGLGLAIAFDIAREHGGSLELRSDTGPGACFVLRVPVATVESAEAPDRIGADFERPASSD